VNEVKISVEFVWYCRIFYVPLVPGYFTRFLQVELCRRPALVLVKSAASFVTFIIRTFSYKKNHPYLFFSLPFLKLPTHIDRLAHGYYSGAFSPLQDLGFACYVAPLINTNDTQPTVPRYYYYYFIPDLFKGLKSKQTRNLAFE